VVRRGDSGEPLYRFEADAADARFAGTVRGTGRMH
jgi:hypothetical protein